MLTGCVLIAVAVRMLIRIKLLFAVALLTQLALEVRTTVTESLATNALLLKTFELVPAFIPFTFHWNAGVDPPFELIAVNVAVVPKQMNESVTVIETVGVTVELESLIPLLLVVAFTRQGVALELKVT